MYVIIGTDSLGLKFITKSAHPMETHLYNTIEEALISCNVYKKAHPSCSYYVHNVLDGTDTKQQTKEEIFNWLCEWEDDE